jgi:hypothetical protein
MSELLPPYTKFTIQAVISPAHSGIAMDSKVLRAH